MKPKTTLRHFLLLAGSSLLAVSSASAQSNWLNGTSGTQQWNAAANWSTNPTVPNAIGAVANLSRDLANTQTVNLATGVTVGSLTYGDTTTGFFGQTISGSAITFNNNGLGATLTQVNTSNANPGNFNNAIILNDNLTIVHNGTNSGSNGMNITGGISGSGRLIFGAGGVGGGFVLSGSQANTFTGGVTFNGAQAFQVGQQGEVFGKGTITLNAAAIIGTALPGGGSYMLNTSNTNVWNSNWTSSGHWSNNGNVTLGANVSLDRSLTTNLAGNIGQTGGTRSLTFTNGGATVLNGKNTYEGGTTVSGGSVTFLKTASMPSTGNVSMGNGTTLGVGIGGDGWTSTGTGAGTLAGIFQGTNVGVGAGSATLSYTTAVGLNLVVTGDHSFGVIENLGSGATAFTKSGLGKLTITGDNTYTGATTVTGGGGLILDYDSSNFSKFASTPAALTLGGINNNTQVLGGGTITLKGGSTTEVASATSLAAGHTTIARDGGASLLRLNAITRAAGGTISFADNTIADTDTNNFGASGVNGILGGWATIGDNWAVSANTGSANTAITALASYTPFVNTVGSSTTNYSLGGTDALTGATAVGTLKITDSGAGQSLTLGNNNLTVTSTSATALGGIMYAGGVDGNYTIKPGVGGTGRIAASTAGSEFIFAVQSGTLTVEAIIGASSNSPLTKTGAGTLVISSATTGSGAINVNQGVLRLNNAAASGGGSPFGLLNNFVQSGAALELTGGFTFTDGERFMISGTGISDGGAIRSVSGANIWRGLVEVAQGGARINNDSAGLLTLQQGVTTGVGGDVTFGGTGNITVNASTITQSRRAINGGGGVIKDGSGTLTLTGSSNYVGNTTIAGGTLALTGAATIDSSPLISINSSTTLSVTGLAAGSFTLGTTQTLAGNGTILATGKTVVASGTLSPGNSPGTLTQDGGSLQLDGVNGNLNWQVFNASGAAGTGYDTINLINGATLDLSVLSAVNQYNINLWSLSAIIPGDVNGDATNFNNTLNYSWTLFSTGTAITGFDESFFDISVGAANGTSGFTNALGVGVFSVGLADGDTDLVLRFTAVPEPSAALLGALGGLLLFRRRR